MKSLQGNGMDLLLYWLPIFGALLLGSFFLHALSIRNQRAAVWYGFGGVFCFVLLFALQLGRDVFSKSVHVDTRHVDAPVVAVERFDIEPVRDSEGKPTTFSTNSQK